MTNYDKAFELISKLKLEDGEYEVTDVLIDMAEWKEQQMIEKATYWLSIHMLNNHPYSIVDVDCFIRDFAKAMKGE